jgi:nitroimidazol reductase NimA-like FMN-containing flavoprotein (pyridoxamine 5'-phosphate oxidase superfamily)
MNAQALGRKDCLDLLATTNIGRVALSANALPTVVPVRFRLLGDHVVFHTGRAGPKNVVAFQVDHIDPRSLEGWSVIVTGVAQEVTEPSELALGHAMDRHRWASDAGTLVLLSCDVITGCRLGAP